MEAIQFGVFCVVFVVGVGTLVKWLFDWLF